MKIFIVPRALVMFSYVDYAWDGLYVMNLSCETSFYMHISIVKFSLEAGQHMHTVMTI